jgi:hypothetical protein
MLIGPLTLNVKSGMIVSFRACRICRRSAMRKGLIILIVGLACLLFAAPTLAAEHLSGKHLHLSPSSAFPGSNVTITGRMWSGNTIRCLGASNVKVKSAAFSPQERYVTTQTTTGLFSGTWTIAETPKNYAVATKCRDVTFWGSFRVKTGAAPAFTGVPALLTLGVGLALTTAGCLMLIAARSRRVQPIGGPGRPTRSGWTVRRLITLRGTRDRSDGTAGGSDTAATRRR